MKLIPTYQNRQICVGIWFRIPLIKSSHKWTRMLFIISNSKLVIWLCSQPRIDLNSQSNFYDVLTRTYKYLSNTLPTLSTTTTCTQHYLHVSFTRLWDFHAIIKRNLFSSTFFIDNILSSWQQLSNISNFYDVRPRTSLQNIFLIRGTSLSKGGLPSFAWTWKR